MGASPRIAHAVRGRSAANRATELADRQFGAIARRQLLSLGFTSRQVDCWLRAGRLHRIYPGVYAYGRAELSTEGELSGALLYAGHGAALGGITALWWLGLLEHRPNRVHIDAPGRVRSRPGLQIGHPRKVTRQWVSGLPVATLPQALLASTDALSHDSLRLVLAREFRHILDLPSLQAGLGMGRPGSSALRVAMAAHLPQLARCASPLEVDFVLLCERFYLELPEPNPRIGGWRPDMLWREARLIVELDGRDAHGTPAQIAADRRREAELRSLGFTVLRFTWEQVRSEPERVAGVIRGLLRDGPE